MSGPLITIGINCLVFFIIGEMLPGFKVKSKGGLIFLALIYSFLMGLVTIFMAPLVLMFGIVMAFISIIPIIGPLIAGSTSLIVAFTFSFILTAIVLKVVDVLMSDTFRLTSFGVALQASFLMGLLNLIIRMFI